MSNLTSKWLNERLAANPDLRINGQVPHPKPKHHQKKPLDQAVRGEEKSLPRVTVRFVGYRVRPLDPDNFAGSVKDLLDGLRHMGAIAGDEPWRIRLETEQEKVGTYEEEKTVIQIIYP